MTLDDLSQQLAACVNSGADCSEIQEKVDRRLERERVRQIKKLATTCPMPQVCLGDGTTRVVHGVRVSNCVCINPSQMRW